MKLAPILVTAGIALGIALSPVRPVVVVGDSMSPTLHASQLVFASRNITNLQRGDVVVVDTPVGTSIKRIAFLEGDQIPQYCWQGEWKNPTNPAAKRFFESHNTPRRNLTIPAGSIYLVGDNTLESVDSREYGPVSISSVRFRLNDVADNRVIVPGSRLAGRIHNVNPA